MTYDPSTKASTPAALRDMWFRNEPRRAHGGWWALSGFSIQMTIALEQFVRAFLTARKSPKHVEVEGLSDVLLRDGDEVRLTQVKRTLTAATLAAALAEAYEIIRLCTPELAEHVTFQVVCEACNPGLSPLSLSPEQIFGPGKTYDADQLALARNRFDAQSPIVIVSNPGLALRRTLLDGGVRNADRVATAALGHIFDAFDGRDRTGITQALYGAVSNILGAVEASTVRAGRLLAPDLLQTRTLSSTKLFSGSRPNLQGLVGQRFRARPDLLTHTLGGALEWLGGLGERYANDDQRLPVLWLDGRPGDGKSVLALQLLQALVLGGRLPAVTELLKVDEVEQWLTTCPKWFDPAEPQAEIGFLDDLPRLFDVNDFDRLVDDAFYRDTPYAGLITCAPSVDCERFRSAAKRTDITVLLVPPPNEIEFETFHAWAEERRGTRLPRPAIAGQSLATFIVALDRRESNTGEQALSCETAPSPSLRAAAAVHVLGFVVPHSFLSQADLDAFAASHNGLELRPEREPSGVRLAHDEVISDLYLEWLKPDGTEVLKSWGKDLAKAIIRNLNTGEKRAARTVLGALLDTELVRRKVCRLGQDGAIGLLDITYKEVQRLCSDVEQAAIYRLWLAASARLKDVSTADVRSRAEALLSNNKVTSSDRADIAVGLLGQKQADGGTEAAKRFILGAPPEGSTLVYMSQLFGSAVKRNREEFGFRWLRANINEPAIAPVLARAITENAASEIKALGIQYVRRFLTDASSGLVLWSLWLHHRTPEFYRLQNDWLQTAVDAPTALLIFSAQLGSPQRDRYATRALAWASKNLALRGIHELLARLLRSRPDSPEVQVVVDQWLAQSACTAQATHLHAELLKAFPQDAPTLDRALRHLDAGAPGGGYLSSVLYEQLLPLDRDELRRLRSALSGHQIALFDRITKGRVARPPQRVRR